MAIVTSTQTAAGEPVAAQSNQQLLFGAMTSLFFIWGFITALNDILIPHLKGIFELSYTQAMLVQFCFFGAYFLVSPLAGSLISRIGYLRGIIVGLCTMATGCLLFYPASSLEEYELFLLALFVLASGITILQVSANPFVARLGPERTAASRLNLAQALNSLGHTLGPLFGGLLIFGAAAGTHEAVQLPYLLLAAVIGLIALGFVLIGGKVKQTAMGVDRQHSGSLLSHKRLLLGALAIFLYVGAEVSIGSFLVNYFAEPSIGGMDEKSAAKLVAWYWGGAMLGRFAGAALTRRFNPATVLAANAVFANLLLMLTIISSGELAIVAVLAIGFFNSIMFPTIFTLAIEGLGELTSRGSGLLCQAIVGGAILPIIQGVTADSIGIQLSFVVPTFCYLYICWYAFYARKQATGENA
ncbi:sugar MFS transporter [Shewanella sp. JM162201]|uniref:Sugar MFS transporter n=1 Tax=Shewanella jiangmenensis TaxID=2837387 RepID=A0ABS5V181_9GAMM|nr:sugar MFS transporter [Shewanella jiangmenensis]MBT1444224.1 sugar MFS transporter [Shewanella jiangmenensis]